MIKKICIYITLLIVSFLLPSKASAIEVKSYLVTEAREFYGDPHLNTVYFYKTIPLHYKSGRVVISANPDGTGEATVGEEFNVYVTYPGDGYFTYRPGCPTPYKKMPPLDITHFMHDEKYGPVNLTIRFIKRQCPEVKKAEGGGYIEYMKIDPLYVVHFDDYEPHAEPFLDLPWDYASKYMSFTDAAVSMSSYFDHEYPLLSANWFLSEPLDVQLSLVKYDGTKGKFPYTAHDGYDYAYPSQAYLNNPVLAAASGIATFHNECSACGNAIYIDHGNGYQTRYYHLQGDGLITNLPSQKVSVTTRQQIGKIGLTGNTSGAHIHFMLIQDKNNDGNFDDNIPDGIVDPYGWQGGGTDPWEQFSFTQNGTEKTGPKSYYLWKNSLSNSKKTLSPDGGVYPSNRFTFTFPKNTTSKDLILTLQPMPVSEPSAELVPIGHVIAATADDGFGNVITQFSKLFTISLKILLTNYTRFKPESLSIYSSSDGVNWLKESTTVDLDNHTATTQVNHLTQFAFMGEKKDAVAPETGMLINDQQVGTSVQVYYEPVILSLEAADEPVEESLGIDHTFIKVNEDEWMLYEELPIPISDPGIYTIQYYSVDKDGNTEEIKTTFFSIEEKKLEQPEFQIKYDMENRQFQIDPVNINDTLTQEQVQIKKKLYTQYKALNNAHQTILMTLFPDKNERDVIKFYSLQYDENDPLILSKYKYVVFNKTNKKDVEKLIQVFQQGNEERIRLTYNSIKDKTTIVMRQNGQIKQKEVVEGFKQLIIKTQNQQLHYSIQ